MGVKVRDGGGSGSAPGTEGARRASGVAGAPAPTGRKDPEVPAKAQRRRFTAEYKRQLLAEADGCREPGEIGALLRREGLYTSHLSVWRQQREAGALVGLAGQARGRKAVVHPLAKRLAGMERENARLREELRKAHVIIDVQKKVSQLLGLAPSDEEVGS